MTCHMCGRCCQLFLINLTKSEYRSGYYQTMFQEFGFIDDFEKASDVGANLLAQKEDGSCLYLKNNHCSIHKKRPQVCRPFCCSSKDPKFQDMIKQINPT